MKRILKYIIVLAAGFSFSQNIHAQDAELPFDTLRLNQVVDIYAEKLKVLQEQRDSLYHSYNKEVVDNPYTMRLFAQSTLYEAPLKQTFNIDWTSDVPFTKDEDQCAIVKSDETLEMLAEQNSQLMTAYVEMPWLIKNIQTEMAKAGVIQEELLNTVQTPEQKVEKNKEQRIDIDLAEGLEPVALDIRRPNFWTFKGDYSLQFTQSYFSDNWYQGGDNNYTMLASATMKANFNNKQKVQWDNTLEMRLGFRTSKEDIKHKFKSSDDLLRLTSKFGYRAVKYWYYTLQVQAYTQFYPTYHNNSDRVRSDFMSPFTMVLSLGMDFKLNLKRFNCSATLSPVSYNFKYVSRPSLYGNFGLKPNHKTYNYFGPNVVVNYTWKIWDNISWSSRIYWFSNLEMTDIEWENTFVFSINKYLSSRLFLYPRIDDSSKKFKNEKGRYFMFKEWFSLGFNYSF